MFAAAAVAHLQLGLEVEMPDFYETQPDADDPYWVFGTPPRPTQVEDRFAQPLVWPGLKFSY